MTRRAEIRNSKFETRNKFQKKRMGKTDERGVSVVFHRLPHFEFVSNFEFRVSSFSRRWTSTRFPSKNEPPPQKNAHHPLRPLLHRLALPKRGDLDGASAGAART